MSAHPKSVNKVPSKAVTDMFPPGSMRYGVPMDSNHAAVRAARQNGAARGFAGIAGGGSTRAPCPPAGS